MATVYRARQQREKELTSDLLKGCAKIAAYLDESPRATYHKLENGLIPAFKLGSVWYARKSSLSAHFDELERARVKSSEPETNPAVSS